jgi:hypothetical protein
MNKTEFYCEPIIAAGTVDAQGQTTLQQITWRARQYTIISQGRQWDETDGRHLLAESVDGTRFELHLQRETLIWFVRKVWRASITV